jgi:DNA polymerase I-like protein with 3'-5' exonuclease and polymerase domains/5'-3' exonuclease
MRLLIDGNSLLNAAILRGVDHDEGQVLKDDEGKDVQVNGHQYGVDNFFDKIGDALAQFEAAPRQCVLVWDGRNAKARRRTFLARYKEGRDKHPAVSEQLNIARDRITQMMRDLGATVVYQDGMEADDLIGYICKHARTQRNVVVTSDGDLSVLVDDNTDIWRLGELNKNPYGAFPHKYITLYKALVGDTSDKIPGAKNFGDAKFVDLVRIFGLEGLEVMQELVENDQLHRLKEDLGQMPKLQLIIDDKAMVATSWRVARLHIEDVNTRRRPWTLLAGMVKQWSELADEDRVHNLKEFYGTKTLVHAGNYKQVYERFSRSVKESPFVAMDIETSTPEESDEWLAKLKAISDKERAAEKVDVLGSELTGMGLTFGANTQHTIYMTVDHKETDTVKNITMDQCRELCELIPHKKLRTVIHNRAFEFPVLYQAWGDKWKDNGWHGFWPNAVDTIQSASYANENLPLKLKDRSLAELGYQQQTYDEVTTIDGVKHKMNELTAQHVLNYGCDDTICTAALFTFHQFIMELEHTWDIYLAIEQKPEYLTSLAFVQGIPISLEKLVGMEKRDEESYEKAWNTLRGFLMQHGWSGTTCPVFDSISPAGVKEAIGIVVVGGEEFTSKKRKPDALAHDIREQFPDNVDALLLAEMVERNQVDAMNRLVKSRFTGEPVINFDSPPQMQKLFFGVMGIRPRFLNPLTDKQRKDERMAEAFAKWRKLKAGKKVEITDDDRAVWVSKASADDDAVELALALDDLTDEQREVLKAYKTLKTVMTRRKLFYKQYKVLPHWKDGKVHPSLNQSRAVTRRYSASNPNVQQLPKRGEGVEFRKIILPFKKNAVVASLDFSGQELRLMAHMSGDANLVACYVGDNLKDVHSLTAVAAAPLMWNGETVSYEDFQAMRKLPKEDPLQAKAKKLREDAKTTNFATQYDAQADTVSKSLLCEPETAQQFIEAKAVAFPGIDPWKDGVRHDVEECGYAVTLMGARRHLAEVLNSDNKWEASKAGRQGPNFYIQGSAGEQSKQAMTLVWDSGVFTDGRFDCQFYFPVHDELVFSAVDEDALEVTRIVHQCMTAPYGGMTIPIVSSISLGSSYGEQIECGDEFDADAIRAAVAKTLGYQEALV